MVWITIILPYRFLQAFFFLNPAPYSLLSTNHLEWSFLKPKSDSDTSLLEILPAKMRKGGLYNDSQGLIWSPLTPFSPRPYRLLTLILSAILFTSSVIAVPSLMATPAFLAVLLPMKSTPLHTRAFELAVFLCREWCYSLGQHGSNLFSLKLLFKCPLLKEITHFNVSWHHHSFLHLFPLVWSAYCFVSLYWSPSNRLYDLFNIMFTILSGFPLSPIKCELHKGTDLCLFFIVFQYSFYCLHMLNKYWLCWIKINVREAIQTKRYSVSEGKIPSVKKD